LAAPLHAITTRKTGLQWRTILDSVAHFKCATVVSPLNYYSMAHFDMRHRMTKFLWRIWTKCVTECNVPQKLIYMRHKIFVQELKNVFLKLKFHL
jgi:hypothetical protein